MNKNTTTPLLNIVWPKEEFSRSTNIELDNEDSSKVMEYTFTPKSLNLLREILDGANGNKRDRAWSIIGSYGSGKSTFSLFITQLLSGFTTPWLIKCLDQLKSTDEELAERVVKEIQNFTLPSLIQLNEEYTFKSKIKGMDWSNFKHRMGFIVPLLIESHLTLEEFIQKDDL